MIHVYFAFIQSHAYRLDKIHYIYPNVICVRINIIMCLYYFWYILITTIYHLYHVSIKCFVMFSDRNMSIFSWWRSIIKCLINNTIIVCHLLCVFFLFTFISSIMILIIITILIVILNAFKIFIFIINFITITVIIKIIKFSFFLLPGIFLS